jgi:hypothetical protein
MASSVKIHEPGTKVPADGDYGVVNRHGRFMGRKVACVAGSKFPAMEAQYETGWVLHDATTHP